MELVQATVLYSEMLVVLAVSVLVLSILWVAGFIGTQLWFSNANKGNNANNVKFSNTRHVSQAVNASIVELQEVPVLVRFSIRVIFGRFRPHKRTEIAAAAQDGKKRYIFQLEHYEDLRFTPEQLHIIKLVHEAMASAVVWLAVRLYTCLLLIGTYILESLWSQLINDAIDLAKTVILLVMLTKCSALFKNSIFSDHADLYNFVRALDALRALAKRIAIMYFATATLQGILPLLPPLFQRS